MLDGMFLALLILSFVEATTKHSGPECGHKSTTGALALLFLLGMYFLMRKLVQIASLMSSGSLRKCWQDPANYLYLAVVVLVFYYGILMAYPGLGVSDGTFRTDVTFTQAMLWVAIIVFLKSTLVDFAVFFVGVSLTWSSAS
jgi:hypothetical protein